MIMILDAFSQNQIQMVIIDNLNHTSFRIYVFLKEIDLIIWFLYYAKSMSTRFFIITLDNKFINCAFRV